MAIPEYRETIQTNLPLNRLNVFLDALDQNKARHVPGSTSVFAQSANCQFDLEGARYGIHEFFENIYAVFLVSGNPDFIQVLINELEESLSVVVKERNYDEAKAINHKIESLKKLRKI